MAESRDDLLWEHGVGQHGRMGSVVFAVVLAAQLFQIPLLLVWFITDGPLGGDSGARGSMLIGWPEGLGFVLGIIPWVSFFYAIDRFRSREHLVPDRIAWGLASLALPLLVIVSGLNSNTTAVLPLFLLAMVSFVPFWMLSLLELPVVLQWQASVMLGGICPLLQIAVSAKILMFPLRIAARQWRFRQALRRRRTIEN
jgi:hypothetical protein